MAKLRKPIYEFTLDDAGDEGDLDELDESTKELLYDKYMEDISEILSRAYTEIGEKVQALVDALEDEK